MGGLVQVKLITVPAMTSEDLMGSRGLVEATGEMQEPLVRFIISFQGEQLTIVNGVVSLSSSKATP